MARLISLMMLVATIASVYPAKQQVMLSDSFLPVAMQVIAHLTDQMTFDTRGDPPKTTSKPPSAPAFAPSKPVNSPSKPANSPSKPANFPSKPANSPSKPANVQTTNRPMYVTSTNIYRPSTGGWWMSYTTARFDLTTPFHGPGLYAPVAPPKPGERIVHTDHFLLPMDHNSQYTVIEPASTPAEELLLSLEQTEIRPLLGPQPAQEMLLPPSFVQGKTRTAADRLIIDDEEISEDNLQYLSPNIREMIKLAADPDDDRLIDDVRAGDDKVGGKAKLSQSNLRLQLLYDLLSREAKKQRLSDYGGFSDSVMSELSASSSDARAQLSLALSRMVERKDCGHDYANNRAKEMVVELGKPETTLSVEVGRLQPLVYKL